MATRAPRATPTPTAAPQQTIDEAGANLPAKRSKLATAMDSVTHHMTEIERLGATIAEVEEQYPKTFVFAVATKEGYKLADKVRKDSRASRLHVATMRKEGTDLLNTLKTELWAVADPQIARLQAIEDNARDQIAAQDKKETDRKAAHEERIAAIVRLSQGVATMDSEAIAQRIRDIQALKIDDSYEEYQKPAALKRVEVQEVLEHAHADAEQREKAEAERKVREGRQSAARAQIAHYKALPDMHEESDVDALADVLDTIPPRDDDAEKYGDMAEFVDMARDKALTVLQAMHKAAVDTREEAARQARVVITDPPPPEGQQLIANGDFDTSTDGWTKHAADDGVEVLAPQDDYAEQAMRESADENGRLPFEPTLEEFAERHSAAHPATHVDVRITPEAEEDPFTRSPASVSTGTLAGLANGHQPIGRTVRVGRAAPVASPAPTPAPSPAPTELSIEAEVPDLLVAARRAIAAFDLLPRNVMVELEPDPGHADPGEPAFLSAMANLRAAVDFTTEFAD